MDVSQRTEQLVRKSFTIDAVKFADTEPGIFTGIASAVGIVDRQDEVIELGAFDGNDLAKPFPLLWQHNTSQPIGVVKFAIAANGDLVVERGELNLDTQLGREAHSLMKQGAIDAMSIGFNIPQGAIKWDEEAQVARILQVKLWEVSLVTFPANPGAVIQSVKDAADLAAAEFKAGKVLSAANRSKLEAARDALAAVLLADDPKKHAEGDSVGHATRDSEMAQVKQVLAQMRSHYERRIQR